MKPKLELWQKTYVQNRLDSESRRMSLFIEHQPSSSKLPFQISTDGWLFYSIADVVAVLRDAGVPETATEPEQEPAT